MAEVVKLRKGNTIKTVSTNHKKMYVNAGWSEVREQTKTGVSSSTSKHYGYNKD